MEEWRGAGGPVSGVLCLIPGRDERGKNWTSQASTRWGDDESGEGGLSEGLGNWALEGGGPLELSHRGNCEMGRGALAAWPFPGSGEVGGVRPRKAWRGVGAWRAVGGRAKRRGHNSRASESRAMPGA